MRIIFSRKGFDSASGGGPSPIIDGRPVSLPIPASVSTGVSYASLGMETMVENASKGRVCAEMPCHYDPLFTSQGTCLFGQVGAAQTHLANHKIRTGDVFLFFGLFREKQEKPHHRIFGYLRIEEIVPLHECPEEKLRFFADQGHPHALSPLGNNDTIYCGPGTTAAHASPALRLTAQDTKPSLWAIPSWLKHTGLSYHHKPERWLRGNRLQSVARGQEFVANIGRRKTPREWLKTIIKEIEAT
ncbi:hypothetical protein D6851_04995 [Altericroceibacterium spongiae]|uniref:Nucleotide modification associated domain-containing protein n=1 Tax=Altericroceibacterium spongiae TaxID=2320269 RepID=A0A420EPH2_9SPHN|nr:hypothetical protein [Altericroceibacterium spongiae]RKF22578.1 hypothetical protein D6851_04995 [Altericroceibacterium spongiae]